MHNCAGIPCPQGIEFNDGSEAPENLCCSRRTGHVSKAAVRLRIGQPALSRQIGDLQQELGLRLFDHVGRGLVLTAEGEQLLADCRRVLADLDAVRERAEVLRRGDRGVLKVAAPPHTIESVLSRFLPRYAERFPNVHVQLTEALGPAQTALLERGEVHVGIRLDQGDPRFESRVLPPADALAVAAPSVDLGHAGLIDVRRLASYPLLLLDPGYSIRRLFDAACRLADVRAQYSARESRTAHAACSGGDWPWRGDHPLSSANGPIRFANCPRNAWPQTDSRASCNSMGQAPPTSALRCHVLRSAG